MLRVHVIFSLFAQACTLFSSSPCHTRMYCFLFSHTPLYSFIYLPFRLFYPQSFASFIHHSLPLVSIFPFPSCIHHPLPLVSISPLTLVSIFLHLFYPPSFTTSIYLPAPFGVDPTFTSCIYSRFISRIDLSFASLLFFTLSHSCLTSLTYCLRCLCLSSRSEQNADVLGRVWNGKVPCKFDTDVNAPALAEFMADGAPAGHTSCAYVTVGTGVGGAWECAPGPGRTVMTNKNGVLHMTKKTWWLCSTGERRCDGVLIRESLTEKRESWRCGVC